MVIKARVLFIVLVILLGSVSLTLGDDRYDYDRCARRCWDKPAHERQVCVAACSRRRYRPDERPVVDPRREVEECRRRCERQGTGKRCRIRCEDLYGDRGREPDMNNPTRDREDQFEQQCEQQCVWRLGDQMQLQCHQRCMELSKEQKQCQRSCQMQGGDQEQCQRTCRQQLEEELRKQQERTNRQRGREPTKRKRDSSVEISI